MHTYLTPSTRNKQMIHQQHSSLDVDDILDTEDIANQVKKISEIHSFFLGSLQKIFIY